MKSEEVLFGTYDELKDWYNSLELKNRDEDHFAKSFEYKPFDEQLKNNEEDFGKIKIILWYDQEILSKNPSKVSIIVRIKKVCMISDK